MVSDCRAYQFLQDRNVLDRKIVVEKAILLAFRHSIQFRNDMDGISEQT